MNEPEQAMTQQQIIDFRHCTIFQKDHLVLKDVSFTVKQGEFVYLIGRVGSGKTSLIKTINAQLPLREGFAQVNHHTLKTIKQKEIPLLRRSLGIVFQDFQLLTDRTVHDNLAFVLRATGWKDKNKIAAKIEEVLGKVDLELKGYKMPHQLSGGEQQRVVIARALLNDPQIILADEPTGNLDPETSLGILEILKDIGNNGRAVIFSTHNYNLLKQHRARTLRCENGTLSEVRDNEEIDFDVISN